MIVLAVVKGIDSDVDGDIVGLKLIAEIGAWEKPEVECAADDGADCGVLKLAVGASVGRDTVGGRVEVSAECKVECAGNGDVDWVGAKDGVSVNVGRDVIGKSVGVFVGCVVDGDTDGCVVDRTVGIEVGWDELGRPVGASDVGDMVGDAVGNGVG